MQGPAMETMKRLSHSAHLTRLRKFLGQATRMRRVHLLLGLAGGGQLQLTRWILALWTPTQFLD